MPLSGPFTGDLNGGTANIGDNNTEFVVSNDGSFTSNSTGSFQIGNPTTSFTDDIFLNLLSTTNNVDAFQALDSWLKTHLVETPPAPSNVSTTTDTTTVTLEWTNISQVKSALVSGLYLPHITQLLFDYKLSSQGWESATTVDIGVLPSDGTPVTKLVLNTTGSGSGVTGDTYNLYTINAETDYDVRVYYVNYQTDNGTYPVNYLEFLNVSTLSAGPPDAPTSYQNNSKNTTSITNSWTKPADHDTTTPGTQTTPLIQNYRVTLTPVSAPNRFNATAFDTNTVTDTTADGGGSNANTSLSISSLYPGHVYDTYVQAKNLLNSNYSANSSTIQVTTDDPASPSTMTTSGYTFVNLSSLRGTYGSSGGYKIAVSTAVSTIFNYNLIDDTTLPMTTSTTNEFAVHTTIGSTAAAVSNINVSSGDFGLITSDVNVDLGGFTQTSQTGTKTGTKTDLIISKDSDFYTADGFTGFWKSAQFSMKPKKASFPASTTTYAVQGTFTDEGSTTYNTNQLIFHVDDLNSAPTLSNVGITGSVTGTISYISGVPTPTSDCEYTYQCNMTDIGNYYVRNDRKHVDGRVKTSGSTNLSPITTIDLDEIDGTHRYFERNGNTYQTSSTLHNSNGLSLAVNPPDIQFNEFTVTLSSIGSNFDDDVKIHLTPYNLYGTGSEVSAGYMNTSDGTTKQIRIDTVSSPETTSSSDYGEQMLSDGNEYATSFTTSYDHTQDITTGSYQNELQLVNGVFVTPSHPDGFLDYSGLYVFDGTTLPDYSGVASDSTWRYVTWKYTNIVTSPTTFEGLKLTLENASGLTVDLSQVGAANHRLHVRVVDGASGSPSWETDGWLDFTDAINPIGLGTGANGTTALDTGETNTASIRHGRILNATASTAEIYVRLGIQSNLNASVQRIKLETY